jgi:hypothetical protein
LVGPFLLILNDARPVGADFGLRVGRGLVRCDPAVPSLVKEAPRHRPTLSAGRVFPVHEHVFMISPPLPMCEGAVAPSPPRDGLIYPLPRFHPHLWKRDFFLPLRKTE